MGGMAPRFGQAAAGGSGGYGAGGSGGALCVSGNIGFVGNATYVDNFAFGGAAGAGGAGGDGNGGVPGAPGLSGARGRAFGGSLAATNTGVIYLKNCVLACSDTQTNASGTIFDSGNNLSSDSSGFLTKSSSLNGVDPMLGALGDYGGATPTVPLLPDSPAINAGDPDNSPPTDQRGFVRPSGSAPDIGAFEYSFLTLSTPSFLNGAVHLDLAGEWSNTALIQVSSDLIHWMPLAVATVASNGTISIIDTNSFQTSRFYRALKQ